jgi:tRNA uridine 5-carboxymethylaminomethyl modification enzyme
VFIEPEGENTDELYVQGMSSSLPEDVQLAAYRSIPGLERCEIMRNAYAIEYDCIDATALHLTLEAKHLNGLYTAGQVNGSSGYEEAAAQGLIAGINAALKIKNEAPLVIDRSEGYIGVLIDDLCTKGTIEPYRMMTSRAEYRLLLRQDNADLRLTEKGCAAGLIKKERYDAFLLKKGYIERETERVRRVNVAPGAAISVQLSTGQKLAELIKRPDLSYDALAAADPERPVKPANCPEYVWRAVGEQVNIQIKYEGYIAMQLAQAEAFKKLEGRLLPEGLDYNSITGLRLEARQKLSKLQPENLGQASRITGVSPADINVLLVYLKTYIR